MLGRSMASLSSLKNTIKMNIEKKHFIQQRDQSDCGVVCLASVISYYDGKESLEKLREISGTNKQGTTLLGLYQAAPQINLDAEAFETDLENLKKQTSPCILHVIIDNKLPHYVICYRHLEKEDAFIISDPAKGVGKYTAQELEKIWISKALLRLTPGHSFKKVKEAKNLQRNWIIKLIKEDLNLLSIALVLGIVIAILGLTTAVFSQRLIDDILPSKQEFKLFSGLALLAFLLVARNMLSYIRGLLLLGQSKDFNIRIINHFYSSLLHLPKSFFDNRKTGELVARMNDTGRIQQAVVYLLSNVMIDVLMIGISSAAIIFYSLPIGIATLLWIPIFFLIVYKFHDKIVKGQQNVMAAYAQNESNYVDTIQGVETIKINNKEEVFTRITKTIYSHFQQAILELGKVRIKFNLIAEIAGTFFIVGVISWSSLYVLNGIITLGIMMAILQMIGVIIPSVGRLALTNIQLQEAKIAFNRMFEFTSIQSEYDSESEKEKNAIFDFRSLSANDLTFRFPGRKTLLQDVSFNIRKGEMIALLGESGCGKTTALQVLQKFYEVESGNIKVNDIEWDDISINAWRNIVGAVPQDIKVFNGTLLDNIVLGDESSNTNDILLFLKEYGFDKYFEKLPNSYTTMLGEEGINISGGQKQLLACARALYKKPQLLLLDEATSAMDRNTEAFIMQLLEKLKSNMAVIFLTHRIQTAKKADCIYVIENKRIANWGTHDQLLENVNLYSQSWEDLNQLPSLAAPNH